MQEHLKRWWWQCSDILGVPLHVPSWREQLAAVITSGIALWCVAIGSVVLAPSSSPWLITSIGATAVLVFAVPHGPLSQPWAVLGGHLLSAAVALVIVLHVGSNLWCAALAVALSIGVMHVFRCMHPPGGATALFVVQSATSGLTPAWSWMITPVLLNVLLLLIVAVVCNFPFRWRRYPAALAFRAPVQSLQSLSHEAPFTRQELAEALDGLDAMLDISDEQLQLLYEAITQRQVKQQVTQEMLLVGRYFSNGLAGENWAVRRIVDASSPQAKKPQVITKTVAGKDRGAVQLMTHQELIVWASYPVYPRDGQWERDAVDACA